MPEGVEVKLTSEEVDKYVNKSELINVEVIGGRYIRHGDPIGWDNFKVDLPLKINRVFSKGKGIFFEFDKEWYAYNTLGMTGQWSTDRDKYSVIKFTLLKKFKIKNTEYKLPIKKFLYFRDIRNFGTIKFMKGAILFDKEYNKLGPDMLNDTTDFNVFNQRLSKHKSKNITKILMNQSIVSGIGNYIKAEALYRAKISPHKNLEEIDESHLKNLFEEIKNVMKESYSLQGNSFKTYRNFQSGGGNFFNMLRVYSKDKDPNGNIVIKEKTEDGRTTHWVKEIQH